MRTLKPRFYERVNHSDIPSEAPKKFAEALESYLVRKGIPSDSFLIEYYEGREILGRRDTIVGLTPKSENFWLHFGDDIKDTNPLDWKFTVTVPGGHFVVRDINRGNPYWTSDISTSKPLTFYNRLKTWAEIRIFK